ncbi:signal recognition particle-docking protein FtsY [Candidatus Woesearchaeota archaeon]|nr:signal recognition particle-docking protein FtsY [Candidatus Woesearchaeota archaeon]
MNILGFPAKTKKKSRDDKTKDILLKPLLEVNSAIEKLEEIEEEPEPEEKKEKAEPKEEKIEELEEEKAEIKEEEKEEEILEETKEEVEEIEVSETQSVSDDAQKALLSDKPEPEEKKKPGFFKRIFKKKKKEEVEEIEEPEEEKEEVKEEEKEAVEEEKEEIKEEEKEEELLEETKEEVEEIEEPEPEEEKKGFFKKLTKGLGLKKLSESKFDSIFFDLELALLENNVAVEVIEKIRDDLHSKLVDKKVKRSQIENIVLQSLEESMDQILSTKPVDILRKIKEKRKDDKPYVIVFVGINGSGKTTTIAKMAQFFMNNGLKTVMVASDTFRAAAIQQLEEHANKLGVKLIKHDYGSDPAAVAFDGIKYAESKNIDVVLVDTAGRLHSNVNLMDEMKKIIRVADPDMKIFIGESITGNDCIEQAQQFNNAIDIDGIVLSKADVDEKGGAAISVSYVTGKPILFIGTGQTYDDLQKFDKSIVLDNLGLA